LLTPGHRCQSNIAIDFKKTGCEAGLGSVESGEDAVEICYEHDNKPSFTTQGSKLFGSTQPLREMSSRNLPGGKGQSHSHL
jgi:hypothetical protein